MNPTIRILVVDDDPDVVNGTVRVLEKADYSVITAPELAALIRIIRSRTKPLRGMIADLLEAQNERKHHAAPLNSVGAIQCLFQFVHRFSYSAACFRLKLQNVSNSILSGKSAMIDL